MNFDTKVAVVIREDLLMWQKLNVTAFTISGIASLPDVLGENYMDASGTTYLPMIKQPITIFSASREQIRGVYEQALIREVQFSIYTEELFSTPHDEANRAAVRAVRSEDLTLVGMALRGRKKALDKLLKGLSLHS
jgi:hypothetical protein